MAQQLIPFLEITGKEESVRYTPPKDGKTYMHVYDFIKVMCKQPRQTGDSLADYKKKAYKNAWTIWHRLEEEKMAELSTSCGCCIHNFGGGDSDNTPVITLQGALKLINWLPGETVKVYRGKVIDLLQRYLAGDSSMHAEIEANATSTAAINNLARESLAAEGGAVGSKRAHELDVEHVRQVRQAVDGVDEVSQVISARLAQQKVDTEFMLHSYEKMCEVQLKVCDAQHKTELAKQETFAVEMRTAEGKAKVEMELAKVRQTERENVQKERQNELLFLEKKQKISINVAPVQPVQLQQPPRPTFGGSPQAGIPKTLLAIAREQVYWPDLSTSKWEQILTRVRVWMREREMLPLPKKVEEYDIRGIMLLDVYNYDASLHDAIRLLLLEAKAFLENKRKTTRVVVDGFLVTISPHQPETTTKSERINEIIAVATKP